ncbi:MAG: hypothetical protein LBC74_15850, partial [Planctomycetaceae bacterium]|jgi:hypothetical protein|nr:hypothetical protein [Planctomycetaceae bacterium]
MENLPPIVNKNKSNNFLYYIAAGLFFCIAIAAIFLFRIRTKKNTGNIKIDLTNNEKTNSKEN